MSDRCDEPGCERCDPDHASFCKPCSKYRGGVVDGACADCRSFLGLEKNGEGTEAAESPEGAPTQTLKCGVCLSWFEGSKGSVFCSETCDGVATARIAESLRRFSTLKSNDKTLLVFADEVPQTSTLDLYRSGFFDGAREHLRCNPVSVEVQAVLSAILRAGDERGRDFVKRPPSATATAAIASLLTKVGE